MSTSEIFNVICVNDQIVTCGQPTEDQLRDAAAEGIQVVINLVPFQPGRSLPDEPGLVASLGLEYHPIPVAWDNPKSEDFEAFEQVMDQLNGRKTLIHCAANYRVTAFYSLYAIKKLGWTADEAEAFRARIWAGSDYPTWTAFIAHEQAQIQSMH